MAILGIVVSTALSLVIGYGLGRMKAWVRDAEQPASGVLLKERLRLKGISVRGVVK